VDALIGVLLTPQGWVALLLIALGLFLIFRLGWGSQRSRPAAPNVRAVRAPGEPLKIPPEVKLSSQPLLTDVEATLYNMMRIAVQEQFLLFSQVPLWSFVEIDAEDSQQRHGLLKEIAFKRAQFVLVHPGTLQVRKVVEIDDPKEHSLQKEARDQLLDEVFRRAKIPILRLDKETEYSIAALAGLLGVEPAGLDNP